MQQKRIPRSKSQTSMRCCFCSWALFLLRFRFPCSHSGRSLFARSCKGGRVCVVAGTGEYPYSKSPFFFALQGGCVCLVAGTGKYHYSNSLFVHRCRKGKYCHLSRAGHYRAFAVQINEGNDQPIQPSEVIVHDDNLAPQSANDARIIKIMRDAYILALRGSSSS